jgi:DNA-binding transcriptional LysR family regulator
VAQPHVAAGVLRHVLPEADVPGPPVHALIPLGRRMPPKTRVMLEHLSDVLRTRTSG